MPYVPPRAFFSFAVFVVLFGSSSASLLFLLMIEETLKHNRQNAYNTRRIAP